MDSFLQQRPKGHSLAESPVDGFGFDHFHSGLQYTLETLKVKEKYFSPLIETTYVFRVSW